MANWKSSVLCCERRSIHAISKMLEVLSPRFLASEAPAFSWHRLARTRVSAPQNRPGNSCHQTGIKWGCLAAGRSAGVTAMGKRSFLKVLCAVVVSLALGLTTEPLLAQRGGHGGGGFHGGGGGFHGGGGGFHGGGSYGGFRGSSGFHGGSGFRGGAISNRTAFAGGFHGGSFAPGRGGFVRPGFFPGRGYAWGGGWGYPGWRGGWGGWGFPGFGWGSWGIGLSFNFGGFWGPSYAYPYPYAYNPWWWAPPAAPPCYYASPCYGPSGYAPADPGSYNPGSYSIDSQDYQENQNNYPTGYSNTDYANPQSTNYAGPTSQQLAESAVRQVPEARPEVRNAIRALSGMPPAARERELATGLYAGFSPEERQVVRAAVFTPASNRAPKRVIQTAVQPRAQQHRREVQNAIRTLQAMPPAARERQINSGVYSSFSPSERQMLKTVAQVQPGM
jgi:hypothetical protein